MNKHYSVRSSKTYRDKYKIVLAGGFFGYEDIDLPYFSDLNEALSVCEKLEKIRKTNND